MMEWANIAKKNHKHQDYKDPRNEETDLNSVAEQPLSGSRSPFYAVYQRVHKKCSSNMSRMPLICRLIFYTIKLFNFVIF